jgi:hypothetical protein
MVLSNELLAVEIVSYALDRSRRDWLPHSLSFTYVST